MAIAQTNTHVNGTDYIITQFGATQGIRIQRQLVRLLGAPILDAQKDGGDLNVASLIKAVIDNLDNVEVEKLVPELVSRVTIGTKSINFDDHFAGKYGDLLALIKEVLTFNFQDVFTQLGFTI